MSDRRTKIVCTLGPSTEDDDVLRALIRAGMNVARLNFSHGTHEYHRNNIERVRRIADELGATVAIMVDTKGPEIRTGTNAGHRGIPLVSGDEVLVTTRPVEGTKGLVPIDYQALPHEVSAGSVIFIDDGLIELRVECVEDDTDIWCRTVNGGVVGEHKGVNVPGVVMELPAVTDQDRADLRFSCEMGVDAVASSFVRDADAVREIRELCVEYGRPETMVIAKIESSLALDNLEEIVRASDGIMVARGDLGVEIPPADVPRVQKNIIQLCNSSYKPVITATQMLESMRGNPRPTRAEVTDVANAIWDGTDCVMLSGETAAGSYPVEAVRMMAQICERAEEQLPVRHDYHDLGTSGNVSGAASFGAVEMAARVGATALVCPTNTGRSVRIMAAFRPSLPILAASPYDYVVRRTCFYWGVTGVQTEVQDGLAQICYDALRVARHSGLVEQNDRVVITAGDPVTSPFTEGTETATNVCMIAQVF